MIDSRYDITLFGHSQWPLLSVQIEWHLSGIAANCRLCRVSDEEMLNSAKHWLSFLIALVIQSLPTLHCPDCLSTESSLATNIVRIDNSITKSYQKSVFRIWQTNDMSLRCEDNTGFSVQQSINSRMDRKPRRTRTDRPMEPYIRIAYDSWLHD